MIPVNTELKVWYTAAYAKQMGKCLLVPEIRKQEPVRQGKKKGVRMSRNINSKTVQKQETTSNLSPVNADAKDINKFTKQPDNQLQSYSTTQTDLQTVPTVSEPQLTNLEKSILIFSEQYSTPLPEPQPVPLTEPHTTSLTQHSSISLPDHNSSLFPASLEEPRSACSTFPCNVCGKIFSRLSQLDGHNCPLSREIDDEAPGTPRRRKGRPRKLTDSEITAQNNISSLAKLVENNNSFQGNIPNAEIINPDAFSQKKEIEQTCGFNNELPVHFDMDSSTSDAKPTSTFMSEKYSPIKSLLTQSTAQLLSQCEKCGKSYSPEDSYLGLHNCDKKARGRPKGSKNKDSDAKPEVTRRRTTYTCKHCGKSFTNHEQHLVHEAEHENTLPFKCDWEGCDKAFNSKFKYERHKMIHTKPENYT